MKPEGFEPPNSVPVGNGAISNYAWLHLVSESLNSLNVNSDIRLPYRQGNLKNVFTGCARCDFGEYLFKTTYRSPANEEMVEQTGLEPVPN